ncbi:ABC transporter substrate-binding protein [Rhodobacteraceae bacterium]|nr:ABC transporter substrate-binding protein [Paracoccaceae bacterium]
MKHLFRIVTALFLLGSATASSSDPVRMTFAGPPPFVIAEGTSGISVDLIRAALAVNGHVLEVVIVPTKRMLLEMQLGNVDGTSSVQGLDYDDSQIFLGDGMFDYSDYFYTRSEQGLSINEPEDLRGLNVVTFPTAKNIYPIWLEPVVNEGGYIEVADQISQVKMLYRGRADAVLADASIFAFLTNQYLEESGDARIEVSQSKLIGRITSLPAFASETIRDDFNGGLSQLRASGRYQEIFDAYIRQSP